jgi:hypothetical protein
MDQPDDIAGRIMLVVDAALPAGPRGICEEAAAARAQRTIKLVGGSVVCDGEKSMRKAA